MGFNSGFKGLIKICVHWKLENVMWRLFWWIPFAALLVPYGGHVTTYDTPAADLAVGRYGEFSANGNRLTQFHAGFIKAQDQLWSQDRGDSMVHRPGYRQDARPRRPWRQFLRASLLCPEQSPTRFHLKDHHMIIPRDRCPRHLYSIISPNLSSSTLFWFLDKYPVLQAKSNIPYFYSKTSKMHKFLKFTLFCSSTLQVSDGLSIHHHELKTVHTATGICHENSSTAC